MMPRTVGNKKGTRRANREGSGPFTRADGREQYQLFTGQHDDRGRPLYKWVYGRTKTQLWDNVRRARRNLDRGRPVAEERVTVGDYLVEWLEERRVKLAPSTYTSYELHVRRYLVPLIGQLRLAALIPSDVRRMQAELAATPGARGQALSSGTIDLIHSTLSHALNVAVKDRRIERNAAADADGILVERDEARPLTLEHARRLLVAIRGDALEAVIRLTLAFGMRRGEVLSLANAAVSLAGDRPTIGVVQQVSVVPRAARRPGESRHRVWPLKTRSKGRRTLPLWPSLVELLDRQRRRRYEMQLAAGANWKNEFDLFFTTASGRPLDGATVTRRFQELLAAADLPEHTFHELRHSAATIMLAEGVPLETIRAVLGHTTIGTTADLYAHFTPALGDDAARRIESALEDDLAEIVGEQLALFDQGLQPLSDSLSGRSRRRTRRALIG